MCFVVIISILLAISIVLVRLSESNTKYLDGLKEFGVTHADPWRHCQTHAGVPARLIAGVMAARARLEPQLINGIQLCARAAPSYARGQR